MAPPRKKLGEILVDAGVLDEMQLRAALAEQRKWGGKLGKTLLEMRFVDEESMVLALARQLGVPQATAEKLNPPAEVLDLMRVELAERYTAFPVAGDRKQRVLHVALADPTNPVVLQELSFHTGLRVHAMVATESMIERAIRKHYHGDAGASLEREPAQATTAQVPSNIPMLDFDEAKSAAPKGSPQLAAQLSQLEQRIGAQVRAIRAVLEILVDKGAVRREDYLQRVRARTQRSSGS